MVITINYTFAGEGSYVRYGVGLKTKDSRSLGDVKSLNVGYQAPLSSFRLLDYRLEAGGWVDNVRNGRKSGGYAGALLGLEPQTNNFYANAFWGVIGITHPDKMLSTHYQFMQDLGFGLQDYRNVRVGINYKHISNAGIKLPNRGRDFIYVHIQIPW